jgi:hypothetical protein
MIGSRPSDRQARRNKKPRPCRFGRGQLEHMTILTMQVSCQIAPRLTPRRNCQDFVALSRGFPLSATVRDNGGFKPSLGHLQEDAFLPIAPRSFRPV